MRSILLLGLLLTPASRASATQGPTEVRVGGVLAPLPSGATLAPHPRGEGRHRGVRIRLEERLTVEVAALPDTTTPLKAYVDSVITSRNALLSANWRLPAAEMRRVGGRIAWVLRPTCGDCEAIEAFLDFPHARIVAVWGVDGLPPLSTDQRHALAWAFVASLRPGPLPRS